MQHSTTPNTNDSIGWKLENTYANLPSPFFAIANPTPVRNPEVVILNVPLGLELGLNLNAMSTQHASDIFSGNALPLGSKPIAQAYAGHQFGGFTMLGDGRAILFGEQRAPDDKLYDLQFKGAGPTKYSRRGDGRAGLGPMLREYIISEAMHGLGIPTTRSLAVVKTGELVYRESALPGAVLTRVASSHIRVGTFQYLAAIQDTEGLRRLADYAIARHYPELAMESERYLSFLTEVMKRQALLIAKWLGVGFIHGVMNTDNMAISGETIDYGPCAFMDHYHPNKVFSSIDHGGRYAFSNQPTIAHWNLVRLAEAMLPLFHDSEPDAIRLATEVLETFPSLFDDAWTKTMGSKLGLVDATRNDRKLIEDLLHWMAEEQLDFTNTFRDLMSERSLEADLYRQPRFVTWKEAWKKRLSETKSSHEAILATMKSANPAVIPRNHRVEEALDAATFKNDIDVMKRLLSALADPFEETEQNGEYRSPPEPSEQVYQTFCGT